MRAVETAHHPGMLGQALSAIGRARGIIGAVDLVEVSQGKPLREFMPALIFPQLLLCGLFVARDAMAPLLEGLSWALPLTYSHDVVARATDQKALGSRLLNVLVVAGAGLAALALGALTLRRRTT